MKYGSVCSGIEAATVAWHDIGWKAAWLSEIEPLPCALLGHHYPAVPNLGDMTSIASRVRSGLVGAPDVLVGGTPCQAFSLAGLRNGLADARGQLTLSFVELANEIDSARAAAGQQPAIIVWENVPGVLSSKDNAFGNFLAGLAGETEPLRVSGRKWPNAGHVSGPERTVVWRVLDAKYFGVAQRRRRVFVVASARKDFDTAKVLFEFEGERRDSAPVSNWVYPTLDASTGWRKRYCNQWAANGFGIIDGTRGIRCATVREWERLQGFPVGYVSDLPMASLDSDFLAAAFKAIGNSMAVPVMRWIGWRIEMELARAANDNVRPSKIHTVTETASKCA